MWGIHIGCEIILHYISVVSILWRIAYLKLKWIVIVVSLKLRKEYEDTLSPREEACWQLLFLVYTRYQTTIPDDWCIFKASFTFFKDSDILKLVFSQFVYTSENISLVSLSVCVFGLRVFACISVWVWVFIRTTTLLRNIATHPFSSFVSFVVVLLS